MLLALVAALALLLGTVGAPGAGAQGQAAPDKSDQGNCATGRTVPASKISIQFWTFNRFIERGERLAGAPADSPGATATRAERLE